MPVHQFPLSRREFLKRSSAAVAAFALPAFGAAADSASPTRFAILSDTHIPRTPEISARDVNMTSNLKQVVGEILAGENRPAGVIITGDCAYLEGLAEDYANLASTIRPVLDGGLPLHLMTGNHDNRQTMGQALSVPHPQNPLVQSRYVSVLETPHCNLFLLDSLQRVNHVTGEIGAEQRQWLAQELKARKEKPAVVVAHHNLQFTAPPPGRPVSGLEDTDEFYKLLTSHPHVKAYVFGHTHHWSVRQQDGIQFINLPPVAYVFTKGNPNGWVDAEFHANGVNLTLQTIDSNHPLNGQRTELTWS